MQPCGSTNHCGLLSAITGSRDVAARPASPRARPLAQGPSILEQAREAAPGELGDDESDRTVDMEREEDDIASRRDSTPPAVSHCGGVEGEPRGPELV